MAKTVQQLRNEDFATIWQIVDELNGWEIPSANGAQWHVPIVRRLLQRLEKEPVMSLL
jgi:hypothetical protein